MTTHYAEQYDTIHVKGKNVDFGKQYRIVCGAKDGEAIVGRNRALLKEVDCPECKAFLRGSDSYCN